MDYKVSPSRIGDYFAYQCDRHLIYNGLSEKDKKYVGWKEDHSINRSAVEAGEAWEEEVLRILQERKEYVAISDTDDKKFSKEQTLELLREATPGYIYQAALYLTESFRKEYMPDVDMHVISWHDSNPDLIRVEYDEDRKCPRFTIFDMKHAKMARINHKAQITIYIYMLKTILTENGIAGYVDEENAYVWSFQKEAATRFAVKDLNVFVDAFLKQTLPNAVNKLAETCKKAKGKEIGELLDTALSRRLTQKCEMCGNLEHCIAWAKEHEPIMLLPHIPARTQDILLEHQEIPRTLEGFGEYLSKEENRQWITDNSGYIGSRMLYMDSVLQALRDRMNDIRNTQYKKPVYAMEMPKYQDVTIVLTAQREVGIDKIYQYGIRIRVNKTRNYIDLETNENGYPEKTAIYTASGPEDIVTNTQAFVDYLYDILRRIHLYNAGCGKDDDKLSVQAYVMDNYEQYNLEAGLFDVLLQGDITNDYRDKLMKIILWMQGERMITDLDRQGDDLGSDFPLVVLTSAVGRLYSIPGYIANNLEDISKAISVDFHLDLNKKYSNPLSNALKSDVIKAVWDSRAADQTAEISKLNRYMELRLRVEDQIIDKLQYGDTRHTGLKRNASKFSLVGINSNMDARLAKIYIENKYEQMITYHDIRSIRMGSLQDAADEGRILKVKVIHESDCILKNFVKSANGLRPEDVPGYNVLYQVLNQDVFFLEPWFAGFAVEKTEAAYDELAAVNDITDSYRYYKKADGTLIHDRINYLNDIRFQYRDGNMYVAGKRFGVRELPENTELYLVERYTDAVGDNTIEKLEEGLDHGDLAYPERLYRRIAVNEEAGQEAADNDANEEIAANENEEVLRYEDYSAELDTYSRVDGMTFSPSQKKAMKQFFETNITLLLGPPGTGKTDFIARAILTLCAFYKTEYNRDLSVLVSANSHAAINNILEKLSEKKAAAADQTLLPTLIKLDKFDAGTDAQPISGVDLYDRWFPFEYDPETGRSYYNKNPERPVLPKLFQATTRGVTEELNYPYELNKPYVVGATSNAIRYTSKKMRRDRFFMDCPGFDVVIIDEASQVRVGDAFVTMDHCKPGTRFMIVGDENQLSPIIKGKYKVDEDTCDIYGSIFRMYYDTARLQGMDYLCQLEENFRMNEILDRYPGEKIYDVDIRQGDGRLGYHAFRRNEDDHAIAAQILSLDVDVNAEGALDERNRMLLDPDYPLVLVKLSGADANKKQKVEIQLATLLTGLLKEHMLTPAGRHYETDEEFWGDARHKGGFAIISPHHEHINRLKDHISSELGMDRDKLHIGTVDKLQGQEREAVIVSYGVSNIEKALAEIEFIYSLNRLNVSITRGKKKTICILTDTLLDKPIELLDVDDADIEKGIAFVCDFERFMKKTEEDTEIDYAEYEQDGVKLEIMRKRIRKN